MAVGEIADFLAGQTAGVLKDAASIVTQGDGGYIKNGQPESIFGKMVQAGARQSCRRYADDPTSVRPFARIKAETSCRPYLEDIGYGTPPTFKKPFTGGQCPAVYRINGTVEWNIFIGTTGGTSTGTREVISEFQYTGPISGVTFTLDTPGSVGPRRWVMNLETAEGTVVGVASELNPIDSNSISNVRFTGGFDIQPPGVDDCAPVPPEYIEPIPPPSPGPKVEPYNPSPDIDIDIGVEINPDGTIDIDFGTGPITIDPWGEGDGGSGPTTDPVPTDPGSPGGTGTTGSGGEDDGEAPEGQELVGVLVEVLDAPNLANTFGRTTQVVYRGVGYVRMGYPGRLGTDVSGGAVISPQFFHAQQRGLTSYKVSANLGYNLSVTPYYRDINL